MLKSCDHSVGNVTLPTTNCMDCPHHEVLSDPDPHDWFCDDDVKVKCLRSTTLDHGGFYQRDPYVTVACRPYNMRKECDVPSWCPLRAGDIGRDEPKIP